MAAKSFGKVGWVLDGGGFKQVSQVGSMRAMIERGIKPDYVQVISVGSANGAKVVAGDFTKAAIDEVDDTWMFINKKGPSYVFRKVDIIGIFWHPAYLFSDKGLRNLLENLDVDKIVASPVELQVATRNRSQMNAYTLFSNHDERFGKNPELFRDVLRASMSIPGFFQKVKIFEDFHCDGLTYSIAAAIKAGCDTIFVFTLNHGRVVAHPENEECWKEILVPFNIVLDELNEKMLREDLSDSADKPSDFKIVDVSIATPEFSWRRFMHGLHSLLASALRGDDLSLTPHLIVPVVAEVPDSLHTHGFRTGSSDFRIAIDQTYEQTNKILDLLQR